MTVMAEKISDESAPERWTASKAAEDLWVDPDDDPRAADGDKPQDERSVLIEYLRDYRLTLEMKCAGLDAEQMARRSVPPSTMSLLGLVRHMADVERNWFRRTMAGEVVPWLYWSETEPDVDWNGAVADPEVVDRAWRDWRGEVGFAEQFVTDSATLDRLGTMWNGKPVSLRRIMVHMIEEYARHCGHADLLRERIDGRVGQ
jgi:uncharacterized damage-inducible protein DinB